MNADLLQNLTVQALNLTLMFSVGLELEGEELRKALGRWKTLTAATLFNFGAIPLLTYALVGGVGLPYAVGAGLLLAACAPGGGTGTLLTRAAGGNLELSVVMLGLFSLLATALTPLLGMAALAGGGPTLEYRSLLETMLLFQLTPLVAGMALAGRLPNVAEKANQLAKPLSNLIFAALFFGLLLTKGQLIPTVGAAGIAVSAAAILFSLVVPLAAPGPNADRSAIALTTGVRNLSLSLLLATAFFDELTVMTVLTYGLIMYLFSTPLALWFRQKSKAEENGEAVGATLN